MNLSPHLTIEELACKDGTAYPANWMDRAQSLALLFEMIRERCGGTPIIIDSAYRTWRYNRDIGGANQSQHVQGLALDLNPVKGNLDVLKQVALDVRIGGYDFAGRKLRGIGIYPSFVHVDLRDGQNATWTGARLEN